MLLSPANPPSNFLRRIMFAARGSFTQFLTQCLAERPELRDIPLNIPGLGILCELRQGPRVSQCLIPTLRCAFFRSGTAREVASSSSSMRSIVSISAMRIPFTSRVSATAFTFSRYCSSSGRSP